MRSVRDFDRRLAAAAGGLPDTAQRTMRSISFLGEPFLVLSIGFAGFISAAVRHQPQVERAFIYSAAAYLISIVLKLSLRRARPHNLDIRTLGMKSYSFPSGHAFGTVVFYGLFSYLDLKYLKHPWNIIISVLLWLVILAIGTSRIAVKAHYASDVIGGWLLGWLSLMIVIGLAF
jgi:undecaprenyl-diphosphatase